MTPRAGDAAGSAGVDVDVGGLTLHAALRGAGPPLVLLHGFTGSGETWRGLAAELAREYSTIAPDLVGHGRSAAPAAPGRYAIRRAAADLVALLSALGHERAAWLGYSLGGRVALQIAADHPGAVAALVLEGASPGIAGGGERARRRRGDEALAARIERGGVEAFTDEWERLPLFATQRRLPPEARARIRAIRLSHGAAGLANSLRGMGAGAQAPLHGRLPDIAAPALLVAGSLDAKYAAIAREMAHTLPDATMRLIGDAGHAAHAERPEAFARAAGEWLRRAYPPATDGGGRSPASRRGGERA